MSNILTVITFQSRTGLPADEVQNSWAFTTGTPHTPADMTLIRTTVKNFYDAIAPGNAKRVDEFMSAEITRGGTVTAIKSYDVTTTLGGEPHGFPFDTEFFGLTGVADNAISLPQQDAVVMSLRGNSSSLPPPAAEAVPSDDRAVDEGAPLTHPGFSRPLERLTGRLYLGPWSSDALAAVTGVAKINDGLRNTIVNAAKQVLIELGSAIVWSIWSRAQRAFVPVLEGWIDDRWDSQRRREPKALNRVFFP